MVGCEMRELLVKLGQGHLFEGKNKDQQEALLEEAAQVERNYPGGWGTYINNAKKLLGQSQRNENIFDGFKVSAPDVTRLDTSQPNALEEFLDFERLGQKELGRVAFCLVAGGLGERLGYNNIKIKLPAESVTKRSFIELYVQTILAYQEFARTTLGQKDCLLTLAIMTSDDTDEKTRNLLRQSNNFGMLDEQLVIVKQHKVPALMDVEARVALTSLGSLELKPHGHGDVHALLYQAGIHRRWVDAGVRWVLFFQDTNPLIFNGLPASLGVSIQKDLAMNSIAVPRTAGEAVGGICRLERGDERLTINVEYNYMDALLQPMGDVPDPKTGVSRFPGNINALLFRLEEYAAVLESSKGAMPEFINPKYANKERTAFASATRIESLMQDFPKLFVNGEKVGVSQFERWMVFTTVKNSRETAIARISQGLPAESCGTAEGDMYENHLRRLELAVRSRGGSVSVEKGKSVLYGGIPVGLKPAAVLLPTVAVSLAHLAELFTKESTITMSQNSTLIVNGRVKIENLFLDGSLTIGPCDGPVNKTEKNAGLEVVETDEADPVELKMRGFKVLCPERFCV